MEKQDTREARLLSNRLGRLLNKGNATEEQGKQYYEAKARYTTLAHRDSTERHVANYIADIKRGDLVWITHQETRVIGLVTEVLRVHCSVTLDQPITYQTRKGNSWGQRGSRPLETRTVRGFSKVNKSSLVKLTNDEIEANKALLLTSPVADVREAVKEKNI